MRVTMELGLPETVRRRGKWYVSSCLPLDVHSQGRTREEARRNLVEALTEFLLSCFERGTLNEVLREAGFVPAAEPGRTKPDRTPADTVMVPLPFVLQERPAGYTGRLAK